MDQSNVLSMKLEKTKKSQSITINYFVSEINRNRSEEVTEQPHKDFLDALNALSPYLARIFHSSEDKEDLFSATGFKYSSNDKIIITGKVATDSGNIVGIASPAINLEDETYGFEEELSEAINIIVGETYQLLIGKKVGAKQLSIDDEPNHDNE